VTNPQFKSIADAAPTLSDLKRLSFERQIMLLLAQLNHVYSYTASAGGLWMLRGSGERGIIRVADGASSVESLWVWFIQTGSELESSWEIRIRQEGSAVCNSVGVPGPQCFLAPGPVITAIYNVKTFPESPQVSRHRAIFLAGPFAVLCHFNYVKVPEPISVECVDCDGESFVRVVVCHIVETARRRDSHTHLAALPDFQDPFNGLSEKADSIRRSTSILIRSLIRSGLEELIDQVSICRMNLDAVEPGCFRVVGCSPIVVQRIFDPARRQGNRL
jgi:hypothetical protein